MLPILYVHFAHGVNCGYRTDESINFYLIPSCKYTKFDYFYIIAFSYLKSIDKQIISNYQPVIAIICFPNRWVFFFSVWKSTIKPLTFLCADVSLSRWMQQLLWYLIRLQFAGIWHYISLKLFKSSHWITAFD